MKEQADSFVQYLSNTRTWAPSGLIVLLVIILKNKWVFGIVLGVLSYFGIRKTVPFSSASLDLMANGLQLATIAWLIFISATVDIAIRRDECRNAEEASRRFRAWWVSALGALGLIYLAFLLSAAGLISDHMRLILRAVGAYGSSFGMLVCYFYLAKPHGRLETGALVGWGIVFATLLVVESAIGAAPATAGHPTRWMSAVTSGLTLCLLVGRLESKLIRPPMWVTVALYFYALIQMTSPFEQLAGASVEYASIWFLARLIALPLKLLLGLLVHWVLQSGILVLYFAEAERIDSHFPGRRAKFLKSYRSAGLVSTPIRND